MRNFCILKIERFFSKLIGQFLLKGDWEFVSDWWPDFLLFCTIVHILFLFFLFLCGFRKNEKRNPIGKGLMAFGGILGVFFRLDDDASPYSYCDGDKEQRAGEIIEITSSPEPEGTTPRMVVGHFESLGLLLEIPPLPETPPAGPSLAPEPEEREQAPSVGLNLDPSQSSRRLDGGERGGNSSKRCLRVEMEESDRRWKVARQSAEASFEGNRRAELLQALEASPFETAKAELVTGIGANSEFWLALIRSLYVSPLTGQRGALEKTIEAILQCQGKPTNSLSSFLDLKCDLEHPEKMKTALRPYLERLGRVYKE
jgi:hypothetical protein